jgi:hypothetical protein
MTTVNEKVLVLDDLEFFNEPTTRPAYPYVTISKLGALVFNSHFCRINSKKLKDKTHVKMGYSRKNNAILVCFLQENEVDNSFSPFKINHIAKSYAVSFSARSFFRKNSIKLDDISGRYEVYFEKILEKEHFLIKLNDERD